MKDATLTRFFENGYGTFGDLITPKGLHYATVERSWLDNQPFISCIPVGIYICKPTRYNKGGYDAIEIVNVPERTDIKMHISNIPEDVEGCIGINKYHKVAAQKWRGVNSRSAFSSLIGELGGETFRLTIKEV